MEINDKMHNPAVVIRWQQDFVIIPGAEITVIKDHQLNDSRTVVRELHNLVLPAVSISRSTAYPAT